MPILEHRFLASKKLYAFDLNSFKAWELPNLTADGYKMWSYSIQAVWFAKRNNGLRAAFFGAIGDTSTARPTADPSIPTTEWTRDEFFAHYKGARYGASPYGCWDGQAPWWGKDEYRNDFQAQQLAIPKLQDMLNHFPDIPTGYDGWYALTEK